MGQQNSREGTPSPIPSDSGISGRGSSSSPAHHPHHPHLNHHRLHSSSLQTSHPTAATTIPHNADKGELGAASVMQSSTNSSDFTEYKHKLERRKRKPAVEHQDSSIKFAKTDNESQKRCDLETSKQLSSGLPSATESLVPGGVHTASLPPSIMEKDVGKQDSNVQRQDVIVTPRSQSQHSSEAFHGACGEEAMDLSVRPTKDSFMEGTGHDHVPERKLLSANEQNPSHANYQSTLRSERGAGCVGVYDSSDLSDGSLQCVSPGLNNNKVLSNDSGSDFDSSSGSPMDSSQQGVQGREELDGALNSPKPGSNMGGIESIVQRLHHQVKSETPSRSDSEDESDYYAVTFKDLIARTISKCDRYGKTQRGKRKRASRTSSELNAARKEEIMAAKKLLERVSKNKRDKFKLTINCSTDGSEHVRNAAASEAIATLVRSVWHKENPKPIGQVIKEMVAKRLTGQEGEGEENDPRGVGQVKRKGPMTIKDILNSRSDNIVEEYDRSPKVDQGDNELLVVSDDGEKGGMKSETELALSAAETLRKLARTNENRDENCADPSVPATGKSNQQNHEETAVMEKIGDGIRVKTKYSTERDGNDDDEDTEEEQSIDHEQRKKAKRRSKKKKRRWAKMFAQGLKMNEAEKATGAHDNEGDIDKTTSQLNNCQFIPKKDPEARLRSVDPDQNQWPAESVKMKGSVAENVVQMSQDLGMGTMRSLVQKIQDEDEEIDVVMETKEIPRPGVERTSSPEMKVAEKIPAAKREPPKAAIISHSISQILEQKGGISSSSDGRSRSSSVISAPCKQVHVESNAVYEPTSSNVTPGVGGPGETSKSARFETTKDRVDKEGSGEGSQGEIKSMSTATEFLIRIALMQNEGNRQGAVETQ